MFYAILSELFSGQSPNSVYTEALKLCRSDPKLSDLLGEPIKGYGELSSRGRRRHVRSDSFLLMHSCQILLLMVEFFYLLHCQGML